MVFHPFFSGPIEKIDERDVEAQDNLGETALMMACSDGLEDIVRLLLDHGADPLLQNEDGERAIDLAESSPEIQTLLNGLTLLSSSFTITITMSHESRIDPKPPN